MFGEKVRLLRRRGGLTQEELAEVTGIGLRTVRDIERGHSGPPRPSTLRLLADAFGLRDGERDRFFEASRPTPAATPAAPRTRGPADDPEPLPAPAQLPADVPGFVGRRTELAALTALLPPLAAPGAMVTAAITGAAGVGKTSLAVHWAHRVADRFPDGQLHVDLRGFSSAGPTLTAAEALRGFLEALGVPPRRIPLDEPARAGLYRSLLAGRRVLVVLDDARDADQVRPLLPGARGCLALVTSRRPLAGLVVAEGARVVALDPLPPGEALALLASRLGAPRLAAEPEAVETILAACAGLPLMLAIVAAWAAFDAAAPLATIAVDLVDAAGALGPVAGEVLVADGPRHRAPAGAHPAATGSGGDLDGDALVVLTALAAAAAPLDVDGLATALTWSLDRTAAALDHAAGRPLLAGPVTLRRVPPGRWTVGARRDVLTAAQRTRLADAARRHSPLTAAEANALLAACLPGLSAEPALRDVGPAQGAGGPYRVRPRDDIRHSLDHRHSGAH